MCLRRPGMPRQLVPRCHDNPKPELLKLSVNGIPNVLGENSPALLKPVTQSWSIIIFCHNEGGTLASVVASVEEFFDRIQCDRSEIVIVDDGSTDNSKEIMDKALETFGNIRAVYHPRNLGIGSALRSGYSAVRNENVSAVPGDGQFDVAELIPYANLPEKTFVSFYRKENNIYHRGRNLLSFINKKVNALLLGVRLRDVNWVKIYKRSELDKLDLSMTSSLVESEICAKLLLRRCKVIECDSVYHPRKAGRSKGASFPIVIQAALETLKLVCMVNLYRMKGRTE
jgi:glycosyltransferase involved in cell wall biosynthesis